MNVIFGEGGEGGGLLMRTPLKKKSFLDLEFVSPEKLCQHVQNTKVITSLNCHSMYA